MTIRAAVSEADAALAESVVRARLTSRRRPRRDGLRDAARTHHHMKNTLSVAQAIVSQTIRNAPTHQGGGSGDGAGRLSGRCRGAQDILSEANWAGAGIADVVANALVPHSDGRDRFDVDGPAHLHSRASRPSA